MKSRGFVKALLLIAALIGAFMPECGRRRIFMRTFVWTWAAASIREMIRFA